MPSMRLSGGRAIILKSLSTLDYDCHYNCTVDVDDRQAQAGLRRDTDFMAGKTAVSARMTLLRPGGRVRPAVTHNRGAPRAWACSGTNVDL